ncbi:hypothetical protein AAE478_007403 [Parahypoxylon ruwenzoriense]
MRKSRSSHIKCDCGEKTHKCAHLKQTVEGHKVPESESDGEVQQTKPKATTRRRRANTTHSEPVLSFDENGHHKPAQRHTKASQKGGPYTINRGSSMHRTGSASSLGTKSVDNLMQQGKNGSRSRIADSSSPDRETRMAKSAQASPSIAGSSSSFQQLNGQLPPLDLSSIRYTDYSSSFDMFGGVSDYEAPMFSAGLSSVSVDWAQYDGLDLKGESMTPSSYDQSQSYLGLDFGGSTEPTLTSNSGDVSETEDFAPAFSESHLEGLRSSAAGSYLSMSQQNQAAMLTANDLSNLDFDQFKGTAAASKLLSNQSSLDDSSSVFPPFADDDSYWSMSNFADGITHSPDPVASGLWDTA